MTNLRVVFDDGGHWFSGLIVAEHINDDTRTLVRVDAEFADPDGCEEFWVNNGYLYPENELEPEEV